MGQLKDKREGIPEPWIGTSSADTPNGCVTAFSTDLARSKLDVPVFTISSKGANFGFDSVYHSSFFTIFCKVGANCCDWINTFL